MLVGFISFPAAALAVFIESKILFGQWNEFSTAVRVHSVVLLMWLIGNSFWMTGELLYEPSPEPGRHWPWYHHPYASAKEEVYDRYLFVAQAVLIAGVLVL